MMGAADYPAAWPIVIVVAALILVVGLVVSARRGSSALRHRRSTRMNVRVGRFTVTCGGATHHGDRIDQCAAWAFIDHRDAPLIATGGVIAVTGESAAGPSSRGVAVAAVEAFLQALRSAAPTALSVTELLHGAVLCASEHLHRHARDSKQPPPIVGAVAVTPNGLYWVSAGDARILLIRARGILRVNRQPSGASETTGESVPFFDAIDTAPAALPLQPGDDVLICNAGLHSRLTQDVIEQTIVDCGPDFGRMLVDRVGAADGRATLVAIHLGIRELQRGWFRG